MDIQLRSSTNRLKPPRNFTKSGISSKNHPKRRLVKMQLFNMQRVTLNMTSFPLNKNGDFFGNNACFSLLYACLLFKLSPVCGKSTPKVHR